jgi:transglutaminase-like putative cysteine protease
MSDITANRNWGSFFLYVFGFILLWEWIRPLKQLTDTGNLGVFVFFILLSFVLAYFQTKLWVTFLVKLGYILSSIHALYFEGSLFTASWIKPFIKDIEANIRFVMSGNWVELSNQFRTILFFILLWLMTYLIHYWLLNRKQIFLFFMVTLIYITILDTFTPYSAKGAIVRTIVTGFAAMGILTLNRILVKEQLGRDFAFSKKWITSLTVLIVMSVGIGFIAPKAEPIWPDPVPFIKSLNEKSGGPGTKKIGYGVDDSELGGPFIGDNSVVFRAEADSKHYWKVETKDIYTGKGWVASDEKDDKLTFPSDEVPIYSFEDDVEVREQSATIYPYINYPHLVYPFGVKNIQPQSGNSDFLELAPVTEKIYFQGEVSNNRAYSFLYDVPKYSVTKLQQVKSSEQVRLAPEFINRYTRLPENLPPEITQLALEITEGKVTWFEKARAVEKYFDRAVFSYDQTNVAVPGRGEDYVAQFLFETKRGYCDNYSTSMAVLLRTLGIPVRWVKGYTAGEYLNLTESGQKVYEVTNNNAHSWVEVYFPGSGWLAFEPTPGYTNNVSLNFDTYKDDPSTAETPIPEQKPEPKKPDTLKENDTKKSESSFSFKGLWVDVKSFLNKEWKWFVFGPIGLALLAYYIYRKRSKWMPKYLVLRYRFKKNDDHFVVAYLALLRQLEWYGLKRQPDQTLRDYAKYVDSFFSTQEMTRLTNHYEHVLYKGSHKTGVWIESKELWENLIKRTIA